MSLPILLMPLLFGAGVPPMPTTSPALPPQDKKAIQAMMAGLERSWRQRDVSAWLDHFTEDADLVNRAGTWFRGRADIEEQLLWLTERGHPELFSPRTSTEALRALAPDVVLLIQRRDESMRQSLAAYVLVKQDERWRVQSLTLVPVESPAAPSRHPRSRRPRPSRPQGGRPEARPRRLQAVR